MKVAIIVFSPTGNTLKAGIMLEKCLVKRNVAVQLLDISRSRAFREDDIRRFLSEEIKEHDVLCIGSPVYAHHLHYNAKRIINSLPRPQKGWGKLAVPFVTYGGINSGIALMEAAALLKKSERVVIGGMKLNSAHSLTKLEKISTKINAGMPGPEAEPLIEKLSEEIYAIGNSDKKEYADVSKAFNYQNRKVRIKATLIFREKIWQRHIYPKLSYHNDACTNCGICAKSCPVQRIMVNGRGPEVIHGSAECIHCASCIRACPCDAIDFNADWGKWDALIAKAATGNSPLASNELPKSQVY